MKFLGYDRGSKAYHFLDGNRNVVISRSASFCEHENWDRVHANSQVTMNPIPILITDTLQTQEVRMGS